MPHEKMTTQELTEAYQKGRRDFSRIALTGANLSSLTLRDVDFSNANLSGSNMSNSDFTNCSFAGALLVRCDMQGAVLANANFQSADLSRANIRKVQIENTNFRRANLMWAHLCGNNLSRAHLEGAALDWSCLIDSSLAAEQVPLIPRHAIFTQPAEEHEKKLAYSRTGGALEYARKKERPYAQKDRTAEELDYHKPFERGL